MVSGPTTKTTEIPAVYGSLTKVNLTKVNLTKEAFTIAAKYKTVTKEILVNKGGLTT
jgi:OOP family OmpA-OmpF porin